jgi:ribosomal protein S18 acetylase RimI-like enzyme
MAHFNEIRFSRLDDKNFTGRSLDFFVRHQTVAECWRKTDNDWKLVPTSYEENWSLEQCREIAEDVRLHMNLDQTGFGAFIGERIVGFATVSHHIFGVKARYAELVCFQISEEYRRQGIGRKLFSMVCEEALRLGAEKLYISSHSSKESQAAYRALGCTPAEEINASLVEEEPFDVQLECKL